MKHLFIVAFIAAFFSTKAQELRADSTYWDNDLTFKVETDFLKKFGELEICIYHNTREQCIENLVTSFEVRIYDAANKEIWNSLWTGKEKYLTFKKNFPEANYVVIKALRPFVINILTGTRIYQDKPLELKYEVK